MTAYSITISRIEKAETIAQLRDAMQDYIDLVGIRWFAAAFTERYGLRSAEMTTVTNFPPEISIAYSTQENYLIDPLHRAAKTSPFPFVWSETVNSRFVEPEVQKIYRAKLRHDIGDGFTVPIWQRGNKGTVSFIVAEAQFPAINRTQLALLAYALHERATALYDPQRLLSQVETIGAGEVEVLRLGALGYSSAEIAETLAWPKRRVDFRFASATRKLRATGRLHAIVRAYRYNFLDGFAPGFDPNAAMRSKSRRLRADFSVNASSASFSLVPRGREVAARIADMAANHAIFDTPLITQILETLPTALRIEEILQLGDAPAKFRYLHSPGPATDHDFGAAVEGGLVARLTIAGNEAGAPEMRDFRAMTRALSNIYSWALLRAEARDSGVQLESFEVDILKWGATGKTSAQIADILGMSDRTIEHHFNALGGKLGTRNRVHTIVKAIELDLIGI